MNNWCHKEFPKGGLCPPGPRDATPEFNVFMIKYLMTVIVGITKV
jgi:hypothetical protein